MTKRVRIENADTSNHQLVIEVYNDHEGTTDEFGVISPKLIATHELNNPTDLIEIVVWKGIVLIVKEK